MVISGDASAQYSFNGGSYTNAETPVSGGANTIAVQVTTSATAGASVEANLSVGGVSVKCVATTRTDVTAPTANILFPPAVSLTEGASVIMRGTVKDEDGGSGVKSVKVNGVAATVDTAKGAWELKAAALTDGVNNLKLVVEDAAGNINEDAARVAVTKGDISEAFPVGGGVDFVGPQTVAWDNLDGRNRALVVDVAGKALVAVDLKTGMRSVLSDNSTQLDMPFIYDRMDYNGAPVVVDRIKKVAYVGQSSTRNTNPGVFAIALDTGERQEALTGTARSLADLAIDYRAETTRMFDATATIGNIDFWDITSKNAAGGYSNSQAAFPNTDFPFANSGSIALDAPRNRLLMTSLSGDQFLYAINAKAPFVSDDVNSLDRGGRSIFSNATTPNNNEPFTASGTNVLTSIRIDTDRNRALMVDRLKPAVFALAISDDPTKDGARSIFSSNEKSIPNKLVDPFGLHIEANMDYALIVDKGQKALMALDLESGERVVVSKSKN